MFDAVSSLEVITVANPFMSLNVRFSSKLFIYIAIIILTLQ